MRSAVLVALAYASAVAYTPPRPTRAGSSLTVPRSARTAEAVPTFLGRNETARALEEEFNVMPVMEREEREVDLGSAEDYGDTVDLPTIGGSDLGDGRKGPSEFELNLGKCIDTLKSDVPEFPDRELVYDIYTPDVQLADPTGVQTRGLTSYKQFFGMIRLFRRVMIDRAEVTYRLRYDWSGKRIIVTWYSSWYARGSRTPAHVDAVSYFHLNDEGLIFKHEVDRVQINGQMMNPPYSVGWLAFRQYVMQGLDGTGTPAGAGVASWITPADLASLRAQALDDTIFYSGDVAAKPSEKKASEGRNLKKKTPRAKLLPGTCENMWDCDSPMQCCDFVLFKMCCNGGVGIPAFQPSLVPIPIPVERDPYPPPPQNGGGYPGNSW